MEGYTPATHLDGSISDMTPTDHLFVDVVFDLPMEQAFTYSVPPEIQGQIQVGKRVYAPLNRRSIMGYIILVHSNKPTFKTLPIIECIDDVPLFEETTLILSRWMTHYYICSLGEALSTTLPRQWKEKSPQPYLQDQEVKLLPLSAEQSDVVQHINQYIHQKEFGVVLVHGVTGSGKTEVYKAITQTCIQQNRLAFILVPEIALTPQTIFRFVETFGSNIAVIHSHLDPKEKLFIYKRIREGYYSIVIGARSAIFCPPERLGIIIIDEEHETTYKSSETPRYHTRQVAYMLAKTCKVPLVLGSATPSLETYFAAQKKDLEVFTLKQRFGKHQAQIVEVIDMRKEKQQSLLSFKLLEALKKNLAQHEQSLLFLNKRGYSNFLMCPECGHIWGCPNCNISLTIHLSKGILLCHYCDHREALPQFCSECSYHPLDYSGYGTERVEMYLKEKLPDATIQRMDLDTTQRKGTFQKIMHDMESGKIDILLGTQMVTKGLHFPNITLVGVLLADISMNVPDFRSAERTFCQITQVSGRSGRGNKQGFVYIQTFNPDHYAIRTAISQDYDAFYKKEIDLRSQFKYPPFSHFLRLVLRGTEEETVITYIKTLAKQLRPIIPSKEIEFLGPSPCPLEKLNKYFRWQILLRHKKSSSLIYLGSHAKKIAAEWKTVYLEVDMDPYMMM